MWHGGNIAFAFFLTEVCQQSPVAMAWLLATSSVINALADGLIGTLLSRRMADGAAASRQQLTGSIAAGLAFAAFCAAGLVSESVQLVYVACSLVAFRIAYAAMDVPQNAFLSYLPIDVAQQEQLIKTRMMTGYAAQLTIAMLISLLLPDTSGVNAVHFALFGGTVGLLAVGTARAFKKQWGDCVGQPKASRAPAMTPESSLVPLLMLPRSWPLLPRL